MSNKKDEINHLPLSSDSSDNNTPVDKSQAVDSFFSDDFKNFFHNIEIDPIELLQLINNHCSTNLHNLLVKHPELGARTTTDILTSAKLLTADYDDLQASQSKMLETIKQLDDNFKSALQKNLHRGHNLSGALIQSITSFVGAPRLSPVAQLKSSYKEDNVSDEDAKRVVNAFLAVSQLIPSKYQKKVPNLSIIVRNQEKAEASFVHPGEESVLVLNTKSDLIVQMAEAFHEYLHLIEKYNPSIKLETNKLLLKRRLSSEMMSSMTIGQRYQKRVLTDIPVYLTDFIDVYTGRVYDGELDSQLLNLVNTEVLSVGGEALILSPTNFYIRDPEHFNLLKMLLLGKL